MAGKVSAVNYRSLTDQSPLIVIVGQTASGKSALALELAERFNGEIISADSWTVYRDFDIGTAKPSAAERAKVPHHLLDVADPKDGFSAAQYKRLALAAINDIAARGKRPILVGGTGLYIDSVIFDYGFLPPATPEIRAELNGLSLDGLLAKAYKTGIDIRGIDLRNRRRLIRLLETNGARPNRGDLRPETLIIGIRLSREQLCKRVTERVDAMLAADLEGEVKRLADKYGWNVEPMKGIGYREFYAYLQKTQSLEQTRERIISATMNLAKRQHTWFKRNLDICWFTIEDEQNNASPNSESEKIVELVTTLLNK